MGTMSKQTNILLFKDTFDYSIPSPRGLSTKTGLGIASTTPCLFRTFSATTSLRNAADLEFQIGKITDLYTEAKDELEYAVEARGTTYYNEDKAGAAEVGFNLLQCVLKVLGGWNCVAWFDRPLVPVSLWTSGGATLELLWSFDRSST